MTPNGLPERVLLVFVDGLGWPPEPLDASMYADLPTVRHLLAEHAVALDATLGVPGLPQSATGQTALMTGVNAAREMGRHVEGFPGPTLREIIRTRNLYDQLTALGFT